ncbi:MAG TPA: META domain-containing protein [Anaerolineae bacterium]|nr:META domain-containing protein [Anaerolineae bacterium]
MQSLTRWSVIVGGSLIGLAAALILVSALWTGSDQTLAGTQWHLVTLNGHAPHPSADPITLVFESSQQLGGHSSCNSYGGTYTLVGTSLTMTEINSTLRACADQALNDLEAEYFQALQAAVAFELANNQLILKDPSGSTVLTFLPA